MTSTVTFKSLTSNSRKADLVQYVNDHVKEIDGRLVTAGSTGVNTVRYELPTLFPASKFSKRDAQLFVYSEIIRTYRARGFVDNWLSIELGEKSWLVLSWPSGLSEDERERCKDIISEAKSDTK